MHGRATGGVRPKSSSSCVVRVKVKITVKNAVCKESSAIAYGVFDFDLDSDSHERSYSNGYWSTLHNAVPSPRSCFTPLIRSNAPYVRGGFLEYPMPVCRHLRLLLLKVCLRAAPLVRVKPNSRSNRRMGESSATAHGVCEFGFDSHEWSCSHAHTHTHTRTHTHAHTHTHTHDAAGTPRDRRDDGDETWMPRGARAAPVDTNLPCRRSPRNQGVMLPSPYPFPSPSRHK